MRCKLTTTKKVVNDGRSLSLDFYLVYTEDDMSINFINKLQY